jgi:hypothetical protein
MKVFQHHLYEYRKGLRRLVLHTVHRMHREAIEQRLQRLEIAYLIQELGNGNINVFFGADECVAVVQTIGRDSLSDYTPEEDFILGTMLGYDRLQQCRRYLEFRHRATSAIPSAASPHPESAALLAS